MPVPLPPLAEQRRIAEVLDRAEALRAKRRAALAQLDTLTQAIFLDLFGDPTTNPMGWAKCPFGDVCETRLGKMLDQKQQTGNHPRPYLRNANVQWFRFDLSEVFAMDFDSDAREVFRLKEGDVLICEGGEPGRAAVWRGEIAECYYQKALHRGRPHAQRATSDYLAWLLWFLAHRGGLGDHVTSATIAHLTGEKLRAMAIPVPPISLQREFGRHIAAVEKLKATHLASLAEIDGLFASLQHRAFRGEL
jgi:type I restriction enzyme S subunit